MSEQRRVERNLNLVIVRLWVEVAIAIVAVNVNVVHCVDGISIEQFFASPVQRCHCACVLVVLVVLSREKLANFFLSTASSGPRGVKWFLKVKLYFFVVCSTTLLIFSSVHSSLDKVVGGNSGWKKKS